eukprot:Pompholyxophrys_punicea_v1_NODE_1210_length_863_cov_2.694307.p1 type:complete len:184 gc:universal NODE_1210_length_863_cov_2.694307:700-149(-)
MVSDFVSDVVGYLKIPDDRYAEYLKDTTVAPADRLPQSSRVLFEYGKNNEGYWKNELFVEQVKVALKIHDFLYPGIQAVFLFDHSSGHRKFAEDALVASHMNKSSGGAQPHMRDTVWNGEVQVIGKKGAEQVLRERGLLRPKMKLDEMVEALSKCEDFANEIPLVEHVVNSHGHLVLWVPKFH